METFQPLRDVWLSFFYLYGVGGIIFFIGIRIIRKTGALNLKLKRHRFWYRVMIFGYFYFVAIHAFFIILGLNT
jgi:hypothetical protein